jgi:hypothetical protein
MPIRDDSNQFIREIAINLKKRPRTDAIRSPLCLVSKMVHPINNVGMVPSTVQAERSSAISLQRHSR